MKDSSAPLPCLLDPSTRTSTVLSAQRESWRLERDPRGAALPWGLPASRRGIASATARRSQAREVFERTRTVDRLRATPLPAAKVSFKAIQRRRGHHLFDQGFPKDHLCSRVQ